MGPILLVLAMAVASVVFFIRSSGATTVSPHDAKLFEERYAARGWKVVALRRIGTDWRLGVRLNQSSPIRKYEIDLQSVDGHLDTRVRGVSRGDVASDIVWRYDREGRREQIR